MPTYNLLNPLYESMDFTESYMSPIGGPMYHNLTGYDVAKRYYDEYGPASMALAPAGILTGGIYDLIQGQNPFGQGYDRIKGMIDFYKTQLSGQPTPTSMAYSPYQADYIPDSSYFYTLKNSNNDDNNNNNEGILSLINKDKPNRPDIPKKGTGSTGPGGRYTPKTPKKGTGITGPGGRYGK